MKKFISIIAVLLIATLTTGFFKNTEKASCPTLAISQIVEHPALDVTRQGILDELAARGFSEEAKTLDIVYDNAQGDPTIALQIAQKFASGRPAAIVALGTTAAQACASQAGDIPVVFSSVTNPEEAGLTAKNIVGVSNWVPLEAQLEMIQKLMPKRKQLGVIYNPGEANSVWILNELKAIAPKYGIEIIASPADKTANVDEAALAFIYSVGAIYVSNDNTALSAFSNIVGRANEVKIPVFVSDTDIVDQGALAAMGPSQYEVGRQTGAMVANILEGKAVSPKVEYPKKTELVINKKQGLALKFQFPESILTQADKIIR